MDPDDVGMGMGFSKPVTVLDSDLRLSRKVLAAYEISWLLDCLPNSTDTRQCNAAVRFGSLFDVLKNFDAIDEFWILGKRDHKKRFHCS